MIDPMRRFLIIPAGLLLLAFLLPAAALADHPCCHPARGDSSCCRAWPAGVGHCEEPGVAGDCHCRLAPASETAAPATEAPATPFPGQPDCAATEAEPVLPGTCATPPPAVPPGRAGPDRPAFVTTGRFLS